MDCIYCDCETRVVDTTLYGGQRYRRRVCKACKKSFYTVEELTELGSEAFNVKKMAYRDRKRLNGNK